MHNWATKTIEQASMNVTNCLYFSVRHIRVTNGVLLSSAIGISLNSVFSMTAILGNSAIILAVWKCKDLQTSGNLLIIFLAITDLLVGFLVQPLFITFEVETVTKIAPSCVVVVTFTVFRVLCTVLSQMTVLLISIEKSLAIFWPFRYATLVSKRRLVATVVFLWIMWCLVVSSRFMGLPTKTFRITVSVVIVTCHFITGLTYIRIERLASTHVKNINSQFRGIAGAPIPWKMKHLRERKALKTTLYIIACLFICYAPLVGVLLANIIGTFAPEDSHVMFTWADTLVFLNSSLNPVIYCMRYMEFRRGIFSLVKCLRKNEQREPQPSQSVTFTTAMESNTVSTNSPVLLRMTNLKTN